MSLGAGVLRLGLALRDERDEMVLAHRLLERLDRPLAADEQRHDEVRELAGAFTVNARTEAHEVLFSVHDTGVGISAVHLPHV